MILKEKNNNNHVFDNIIKERYTHVFISPNISFTKRFKNTILDQIFFNNWFALLSFEKIYPVEK